MHTIEPYYRWLDLYDGQDDEYSPFFQKEYSEFMYSEKIYDHFIHPQWDNIGSSTLFIKVLYADYIHGYVIMELMGEWNDCLHNDIMILKRNIVEHFMNSGVDKFIMIGENVLNFHASDDCYYEEWFDEVEETDGWICMLNFREHVMEGFEELDIDQFFVSGGNLNDVSWRTYQPQHLFGIVEDAVMKRLGTSL